MADLWVSAGEKARLRHFSTSNGADGFDGSASSQTIEDKDAKREDGDSEISGAMEETKSEASSSKNEDDTLTAVKTIRHQLGNVETRPGRTRAQTHAIEQQSRGGQLALQAMGADAHAVEEMFQDVLPGKNKTSFPLGLLRDLEPESQTCAEVCTSKYRQVWEEAMTQELTGLKATGTFTPSSKPEDRKLVGAKRVFRLKTNEKGMVVKANVRLVAKGFCQKANIDYLETYAPTPTTASI